MQMLSSDKENMRPSMCSTPIVNKKTKPLGLSKPLGLFHSPRKRIPLSPSRNNPSTLSPTSHNPSKLDISDEKETQCDLKGLSERTQIMVLQNKLMKSNVARDKHENSLKSCQEKLGAVSSEGVLLRGENEKLREEVERLRESKTCDGEECVSKQSLLSERRNYIILTNSHKELEMQICHLSSQLDIRDSKVADMFSQNKQMEERVSDAEKRCGMYQGHVIKLDSQLGQLKSSNTNLDSVKRDLDEVKLNRSKLRAEIEFLLDERDTREITLEEIYKQLTESRKELAVLRETDEQLQMSYKSLCEKSELIAKEYAHCKDVANDAAEMCDFLQKKLSKMLPGLCIKHNVPHVAYPIKSSCPPLIGNVLYINHAVEMLEDLAGSVSINRETRKQLSALREDKSVLESELAETKLNLADQTDRLRRKEAQTKGMTETIIRYTHQIETSEEVFDELRHQLKEVHAEREKLEIDNERQNLQVSRQREDLAECREQLLMYDQVLHTVKTKMSALGSGLPSSLKLVLKQLV